MADAPLQTQSERVAVGQVWAFPDGSRFRVEGFSKTDAGWVKIREIGGERRRGSYPPAPFVNAGGFVLCEEAS